MTPTVASGGAAEPQRPTEAPTMPPFPTMKWSMQPGRSFNGSGTYLLPWRSTKAPGAAGSTATPRGPSLPPRNAT
eukprot:224504-Pyramimonas_sp.AAC.1